MKATICSAVMILSLAGCASTEPLKPVPIVQQEPPKPPPTKKVEAPKPPPVVIQAPVSPLVGTWNLIASSEAKGETATGIPDYVLWQTIEFTGSGKQIIRYQHERGDDEVFLSEIDYEFSNGILKRIARLRTSDWKVKIKGKRLEIRSNSSYEIYERK